MVEVDELIKRDHIPVSYGRPNHHTAYDDSPRIWHKLPRGYVQVMEKLHYEWVDRKSEAAQERSLIKANLTISEGTGLFALPRETNLGLFRELERIPEPTKSIYFQRTLFFKGVKGLRCSRNRRARGRGYERRHRGSGIYLNPSRASTRWRTRLQVTRSNLRSHTFPS